MARKELVIPSELPNPYGNNDLARALMPAMHGGLGRLLPHLYEGDSLKNSFVSYYLGISSGDTSAVKQAINTIAKVARLSNIAEVVDGVCVFGTPALAANLERSNRIAVLLEEKPHLPFNIPNLRAGAMIPWISCRVWLLEQIRSHTLSQEGINMVGEAPPSTVRTQVTLHLRALLYSGAIHTNQDPTWMTGLELRREHNLPLLSLDPEYEPMMDKLADVRKIVTPDSV